MGWFELVVNLIKISIRCLSFPLTGKISDSLALSIPIQLFGGRASVPTDTHLSSSAWQSPMGHDDKQGECCKHSPAFHMLAKCCEA